MREFDQRTTSFTEEDVMEKLYAIPHRGRENSDLLVDVNQNTPGFPLKVQIQTSTRCNAACAMCPYPEITGEPGFVHKMMDEGLYLSIVDQMVGKGVQRLALFLMNEPLLDKRLPKWMGIAKEKLPETELILFSNGSALTEKMLFGLANAGLNELNISVHGFDAKTYSRVMKGLNYDRTLKNVRRAMAASNENKLNGMKLQLVTGDLEEINTENAPPDLLDLMNKKAFSNERSAADTAADLPSSSFSEEADRPLCQRPFVKLYILTDGDCVLCNVDWRKTEVLGRLSKTVTIDDVWNGERYQQVRLDHLRREWENKHICERCDYPMVVG
jgi:hypothetical protein